MTVYHCHHCKFSTRSFAAMAKHSRSKHPSVMKRKPEPKTLHRGLQTLKKMKNRFCPTCGQPL